LDTEVFKDSSRILRVGNRVGKGGTPFLHFLSHYPVTNIITLYLPVAVLINSLSLFDSNSFDTFAHEATTLTI
jgi:hypothetical protein